MMRVYTYMSIEEKRKGGEGIVVSIFPSPFNAHAYALTLLLVPYLREWKRIIRRTSFFSSIQPNSGESLKTFRYFLFFLEINKESKRHTSFQQ